MQEIEVVREMKLLIVDDDTLNLSHLERSAREWGYEVETAGNGFEAWETIQKCPDPMLIIVDWVMPKMDGVELCRRLRAFQPHNLRYIIMLTVRSDKNDIAAGLDAGADDYLTKPVHLKELQSRLSVGRRVLEYQYKLETLTEELLRTNQELHRMVAIDGLTSIANRRHFEQRCEEEWRRATRDETPVSLIMIDIDYFKKYNDTYGHLVGDECLKKVAGILASTAARAGDLAARYGGEEFAVLLPNTDSVGTAVVAEALRSAISGLQIEHSGSPLAVVTVSAGIATVYPCREESQSPAVLLDRADRALYQAKAAGRNNVRQSV